MTDSKANVKHSDEPRSETTGAGPAAQVPAALAERLGPEASAVLEHLLPASPDPESAVAALDRLLCDGDEGAAILAAEPGLLEPAVTIFSQSQYLSETLIQQPALLYWLGEARRDGRARGREEWSARLGEFLAAGPLDAGQRARALTRFKRREYLRIAIRDLSGLAGLAETTQELSQLADAILAQAYVWSWNELVERMEPPAAGAGPRPELAVMALGKLGGEELNYSSDIDLMFLYGDGPEEAAARNREFFTRLAQRITAYVSETTAEGAAYRVDLRLRPGGREGELALPLARAVDYYRREAREWERQMLIRARPSAGALEVGEQFLAAVRAQVYPPTPDAARIAAGVRRMRQQIHQELEHRRALRRRADTRDVKLDAGGIRDIEFLCQYLQRLHGGGDAWLRAAHTALALQRLHDKGWLSSAEFQMLSSGYWLLRTVEHRLQLHLGQQTHSLPAAPERLTVLARSLLAAEGGRQSAAAGAWQPAAGAALGPAFAAELDRRMHAIREIYLRRVGTSGSAEEEAEAESEAGAGGSSMATWLRAGGQPDWARRLIRQMPVTRHGARQLQRLLRSAATISGAERVLEQLAGPALAQMARALDASDWMAEMLIRRPALAECFLPAQGEAAAPEADTAMEAIRELRLDSQRQRFAVIAHELASAPASTQVLAELTRLAEAALGGALAAARRLTGADEEAVPLCVLGLGRLGLGELDLLSDLDLVFLTTEAAREPAQRLAARLIEVVTAYTRDGLLYAVDTRLRPGGGEGELVQTAEGLAAYFGQRASAWEAASFLKARPVAGDVALGDGALEALWRAWEGRRVESGALRQELLALRQRMEREGHPGRWGLKTPPGGFYDADFIVSRRMLVQTPVPRRPGVALAALAAQTDVPEAAEIAAAVALLRAADHALRVATGKAGRAIPAAGDSIARAEQWLARMWPHPLPQTLGEAVEAARVRLRHAYETWM